MNPLSGKKREELAAEIVEWLVENELWVDVRIYFNGKYWGTHNPETGEYYYNELKYYEGIADPRDYFEYVNEPENILSMSFEGPLYEVLNGYRGYHLETEFNNIFTKYGLYFELGNAWNLTACEVF